MGSRRKDMWKLLYNLVNRSEAELNDVFNFVIDILCKEPSLIRPYSKRELNNRFQDTFILWLINKFVKSLAEQRREEFLLKNIKLQQKILTSCLVNRTILFERLVVAYMTAIAQLCVEQLDTELHVSAMVTEQEQEQEQELAQYLEIKAFLSEDDCLREIDANFSFKPVRVCVDDVDNCVNALLHILRHALSIGYEVYPTLFLRSLESVFKALKECDMFTKLLSLRYCHALFQVSYEMNAPLEYYYELTMRAIALIWEQIPLWLHADCLELEELAALADITIALLEIQKRFTKQLHCEHQLLQLAFNMLQNIAEIVKLPELEGNTTNWSPLFQSVIQFMLILQLESTKGVTFSIEQSLVLLHLAEEHAQVLRLLAAVVVQQDTRECLHILKQFKQKIFELLCKTASTRDDMYALKEVLTAVVFMEHYQCKQQQIILLKEQQSLQIVKDQCLLGELNVFLNVQASNGFAPLDTKVEQFLQNAEKIKSIELRVEQMCIANLLLQSTSLRKCLSVQLQQKLIALIEKPLKNFLASASLIATAQDSNSNGRELANLSLQILSNISVEGSKEVTTYLQRVIGNVGYQLFKKTSEPTEVISELRLVFCDNLNNLIVTDLITPEQIIKDFIIAVQKNSQVMSALLRAAYCGSDSDACHAFMLSPYGDPSKGTKQLKTKQFVCIKCTKDCSSADEVLAYIQEYGAILMHWSNVTAQARIPDLSFAMKQTLCQALFTDKRFSFLGHHLEQLAITAADCFEVFSSMDISAINVSAVHAVLPQFVARDDNFLTQIAKFTLQQTFSSLQSQQTQQQLQTLGFITACVSSDVSEQWLFHFYKMTFFFLVHPDSRVVHETVLCANEMCITHNVQPTQLWNWYKRDALSLIVKLTVYVYLRKGVRLMRSLKAFTKMLGFSCVQEFVCKYYRLLTTMLLPYCVKEPQCKGLLVNISKITRKPISTIFVVSFLRIYTHIYLTEEADIGNKCIELIVKCTDSSLNKLMNSDVKQTVSEFLIYFNRNPKFVMQAFQCLFLHENSSVVSTSSVAVQRGNSVSSTSEFAKFIADRFLGVITYFETCLAEPSFEKPLKEEALYSLGQIIRFVGAQHVTQFRFKIIAMLSFVLSLDDRHLQGICLKIWNIFLHIVDIQALGPSLSRIVASLQPLLAHKQTEVNAIYEYLILKNDSLLGTYIPDLYFVEHIESVAPAIRQCVTRQTELLKGEKSTMLDKMAFLFKQITNENLQVRIYGLSHLRSFIASHREAVNDLVLSEIRVDPLIEKVVDILIAGCRHEDRYLQLASATCLGELGAIDPSYMPSNYSFEQSNELSLSVHTDGFAVMALTELCRAYQFQKDTKYVDNFSLAIQETLSVCGVSPKENKKLNVWQAIPRRMRQIMEPLLNSCYTASRRETKCKEHPIFNSSFCRKYEDWAFIWASRLIDCVQSDETKHLLNSYKPSIKRDNNTLALFFPYIVLHALQSSNDVQMLQMQEEFEAVFGFASRGVVTQPEYETSGGMKEFLSSKYSADRSADVERKSSAADHYEELENITRTCVKLCSEQIDFLQRWKREWQRLNIIGGKMNASGQHFNRIEDFVAKFDKGIIARANYNSGEYARALLYLEEYIEEQVDTRLQQQLSFLIEIYGNLMDADSVEGAVYMKKCNLTLGEQILVNRIVDRSHETMICYEQLMSSDEPISQDHIKGMISCYLRMDTPHTALLITDGLWQKLTEQYTDDYFKECKAELLWRLGNYDGLQELLEDSVVRRKTSNWNIQCAEAFLLFRQPARKAEGAAEFGQFVEQLDIIRGNVLSTMRSYSGVKQNSYTHSYDEVVKLHLLNEVEKNRLLLNHITVALEDNFDSDCSGGEWQVMCLDEVRQFFANWDARLCVLQPVVRVMEPLLCFRRNLLIETKRLLCHYQPTPALLQEVSDLIDTEVGKLWIRSAQMNRDAGSLQQAHLSIMKAENYQPKTLFIEKAKLLWEKGDQTNTFKLLEENLERIETKCERDIRALSVVDRALYAEAKYLQATYNAESMNICAELNLRYFKEAISGNRHSEKCHVQLAQYMEKMYDSFSKEQREGESGRKLILDIMLNYAKSLKCGFENVYQSLPRLLSFWLDLSAQYASMCESATAASDSSFAAKTSGFQELVRKMNDLMNNCSTVLPTSIFYTAFSQLLSRICHPSMDVYNVLRTIVIKLVEQFPQQSLWMLLPVFKSSYTNRIKRCKLIFTDARLAKPQFQKLLVDFNMLAERLIELTNKEVALDQTYELSTMVKQLPKLFEDTKFSQIMLPFEKYMQASFPITPSSAYLNLNVPLDSPDASNISIPTNPFPYKQIFISGINEEVIVLRSAAKPKKISIQCSDGKNYEVMVKPKDDLRKDFRLMEFNGLVKRYLHQDSQARHRRLHIRTYAAIPFNEECGLVEWLPKLNSYRGICTSIYRTRGQGLADRMLRTCVLPKTEPLEKKRKVFLEMLLPNHPPVFQDWLRQRFPTPHSWYEARCAYVKTIAVMSMVGYILGLGDRHGENVLFDETNGDAVHVDFNCLFNQGETFAYPELVPFRLTQNMIFAMGPLGVEGMFRKSCEITLRLLKQEARTLSSVLRPFVYDLVALSRNYNKKQSAAELTDPKAMQDVRRIEERLKGYVKRTLANSMPLSTEGQVNFLINEATDIDNLAAMYIGWGAFI